MWAGQESILSLDGGAFTLILRTVKLVLGDLAPAVIYGLVTVIHAERIAHPQFLLPACKSAILEIYYPLTALSFRFG